MTVSDRIKSRKVMILMVIILLLFAFILIDRFFITLVTVRGASMDPNFCCGDRVLIISDRFIVEDLKTGDVVVFQSPVCEDELFIKRVIARGGQEFCIDTGDLLINGESVCEDYIDDCEYIFRDYRKTCGEVPEGKLYLLGDNRNSSNDSRTFGYISES